MSAPLVSITPDGRFNPDELHGRQPHGLQPRSAEHSNRVTRMAARTTPGKSLTWSVASKCATRRKVFAIVRLLIAGAGFTNGWNARANQAPTAR